MNRFVRNLFVFAALIGMGSTVKAQHYFGETIIQSGPIYSTPISQPQIIYESIPAPVYQAAPATDPVANCCGGASTGDCTCKNLGSCELQLTPKKCKKNGKTTKTPIPPEIYGKIPKIDKPEDCYELIHSFDYATKVPTIECKTVICKEIGKRTIQCEVDGCRPGCSFKVCVPINDCTTRTVECKLVDRTMPHKIFRREDPLRGPTYDVYVINNPDPNSPNHAGGMPPEWLIMHCASKRQVQAKFPGMIAANQGKNIKPQSTEADVEIQLMVNEEMLQKLLEDSHPEKISSESVSSDPLPPNSKQINSANVANRHSPRVSKSKELAVDTLAAIEQAIAEKAKRKSNEPLDG